MEYSAPPCFAKSRAIREKNRGLLKNRFEFLGVLDRGYLKIDAGELIMFEDISYVGQVKRDDFDGEGELRLCGEYRLRGLWRAGVLYSGRITFQLIQAIEYIEVNCEKKVYRIKMRKELKPIKIYEKKVIEFSQGEIKFTLSFELSELQHLVVHIAKETPMLALAEKKYRELVSLTPSLHFRREFCIDRSRISFTVFASYKVEYETITAKQSDRFLVKSLTFYPNGSVFCGTLDNMAGSSEATLRSKSLNMPGYLIDLDEYYLDNAKRFPAFSAFSRKSGYKSRFLSSSSKVSRAKVDKSVFGRILQSVAAKTPIFATLVKEEIESSKTKFKWVNYTPGYFDNLMASTRPFRFEERASKELFEYGVEKRLVAFRWGDVNEQYFNSYAT